jgi:hypothetical protein
MMTIPFYYSTVFFPVSSLPYRISLWLLDKMWAGKPDGFPAHRVLLQIREARCSCHPKVNRQRLKMGFERRVFA